MDDVIKTIEKEFVKVLDDFENGNIDIMDVAIASLDIAIIQDDEIYQRARKIFENAKTKKRAVGKPRKINIEDILLLKIIGKTQKQVSDELKISISTVRRAWGDNDSENKLRNEIDSIKLGGN
jgi:DNA invertase Pin-like site-specific DNA recombinase